MEADPRHAEIVIRALRLGEAKMSRTLGVRQSREREDKFDDIHCNRHMVSFMVSFSRGYKAHVDNIVQHFVFEAECQGETVKLALMGLQV